MSHYGDNPKELAQDAKQFLSSQYGKYIMEILDAKEYGLISAVTNLENQHVDRYAAKLSAIREVKELLQPLDDDIPTHG
jgi:hypothetical protein